MSKFKVGDRIKNKSSKLPGIILFTDARDKTYRIKSEKTYEMKTITTSYWENEFSIVLDPEYILDKKLECLNEPH